MSVIHWLHDCAEPARAGIGGKGASLARLCAAGFPVPPGFVIGAAGYRAWIDENGLAPRIAELLATPNLRLPKVAREASAPLREAAEQAALPGELRAQIAEAYARLQQDRGAGLVVAVRSSALSEDGGAASSAGLYETYLNLRDEAAVLDGVARCYRSLWAHRAVQYRAFKGIDSSREAMAVVVMELVPARVAGVAFTVNPITRDANEIMINASWGLGEAIVSGRVTPDSFIVRKPDLSIAAREIYEKEIMVTPDPAGGSGTVTIEAPATSRHAPALDDAELQELARLCLRVEQHYGGPQDIEWAFDDRALYLLQSRPVTALA
ncbi:MAG TPA: PEP/pyruvate-binding domain-containing protein [Dehalococcoidia bacterium]|nr:PEP/pyruvate-binding domain-containing protein [Dehalococcoidia bacterium]